MSGWPVRPLADCASIHTDRVRPEEAPDLPFVGLEHIGEGTLHLLGAGRLGDVAGPGLRVEPGDLVYGALRPYFRKLVRAPHALACTPEAWVLRASPGIDPGFLFYRLADPAFSDACSRASTGTRMPRADWSFAERFPIAVPPLDEQHRIAGGLGLLDARIALHRASNRALGDLLAARLRACPGQGAGGLDAIVRPVREPVQPAGLDPDTPTVGLEHVPRRSLALERWGRPADAGSTKHRFARGDVLFGRLRPGFHKVVLAPVDGVCSPDLLVLRPVAAHWRAFALAWLGSDALVAHATACADGTRMPRVSWQALAGFPVGLPTRAQAEQFEADAGPLVDRILANVASIRALTALRDRVLPGLVTGRVRVPELPV